MAETEQEFLANLEKKLWTGADKLRSTLDAAQYKHAVLGLVFLKYVSDSFVVRRREIETMLRDENHDYGVIRGNYDSDEEYRTPFGQNWKFATTTPKPTCSGYRPNPAGSSFRTTTR